MSHDGGPTADFESFTQRCQSACSASMLPVIRPARTSACRTDRYSCSRSIVLVVIGCVTLVAAGGWLRNSAWLFHSQVFCQSHSGEWCAARVSDKVRKI